MCGQYYPCPSLKCKVKMKIRAAKRSNGMVHDGWRNKQKSPDKYPHRVPFCGTLQTLFPIADLTLSDYCHYASNINQIKHIPCFLQIVVPLEPLLDHVPR